MFHSFKKIKVKSWFLIKHKENSSTNYDGIQDWRLFDFDSVKDISFSDKSFKTFEITELETNCFVDFSNLEEINVSFCHISQIEGKSFYGLRALKKLNLSSNQIVKLDDLNTFQGLDNLEELDMRENQLVQMDAEKHIF